MVQFNSLSLSTFVTIGKFFAFSSIFSIFAEADINLFFIINKQYTASWTEVAPKEWPVNDFVELIFGIFSLNVTNN